MTIKTFAAIASMSVLLTGCGGSGGGTVTPPAAAASPGGIWTGTDSGTGMQVTALIAESGQMDVIRSDRAQFFGTIAVNGNSISAAIEGDAAFGSAFPDGSVHGTGKVTGTLAEHSSIQATVAFTTDNGESTTSSITLAFQASYMTVPDVASLAGTYINYSNGAVLAIDTGGMINSSGAIFVQDPATGCMINGNVHVVDGTHSLYTVLIDYSGCTGSLVPLNGLSFDGFATFTSENALVGLLDKSGNHYGLVLSLSK